MTPKIARRVTMKAVNTVAIAGICEEYRSTQLHGERLAPLHGRER